MSTKTEGGRVGKKLGEAQNRSLVDVLKSGNSASLGEFLQAAFDSAGGAKEVGGLFGQILKGKNVPKQTRLEITKALANLTLQYERLKPGLTDDEVVRLTEDQIDLKFSTDFGITQEAVILRKLLNGVIRTLNGTEPSEVRIETAMKALRHGLSNSLEEQRHGCPSEAETASNSN